jgi:tetratricopeptide (TPR) repeat protein
MAIQHMGLGDVNAMRRNLSRAEEMYTKALVLFKELGATRWNAMVHLNLGQLHEKNGNMAEACASWRKAQTLYDLAPCMGTFLSSALSPCFSLFFLLVFPYPLFVA